MANVLDYMNQNATRCRTSALRSSDAPNGSFIFREHMALLEGVFPKADACLTKADTYIY